MYGVYRRQFIRRRRLRREWVGTKPPVPIQKTLTPATETETAQELGVNTKAGRAVAGANGGWSAPGGVGSFNPAGSHTAAFLLRRTLSSNIVHSTVINASVASVVGYGFNSNQPRLDIGGSTSRNAVLTVPLNEWVIVVYSRTAGAGTTGRAHLFSGGAWSHADLNGTQNDPTNGPPAGMFILLNVFGGLAGVDTALAAGWNRVLSDAEVETLDNNRRTTDWLNVSGGAPIFLTQMSAPSAADVTGGGLDFTSSLGTTILSGPANWTYTSISKSIIYTTSSEVAQVLDVDKSVTIQPTEGRKNLAINPRFENDPFSPLVWRAGAAGTQSVSWDTAQAHSGTHSLKTIVDGSVSNQGAYAQPAYGVGWDGAVDYNTVFPGPLSVSVYVYVGSGDAGKQMFVQCSPYSVEGNFLTNITGSNVTLSTGWNRLTLSGTAPARTRSLQIQILTTSATAITYWADDLLVEQSSSVGTYFDGSTVGAQWGSSADNSMPVVQTEQAQAITFTQTSGTQYKDITNASETDAAQVLSITKTIYKSITNTSEADSAQALVHYKVKSVTNGSETDAAQTLSKTKTIFKTLTVVTETDAAQALIHQKSKSITNAAETDSAQAIDKDKARVVTTTTETDAAQALVYEKIKSITNASETNSAQALDKDKYKSITTATETDSAQTLSETKTIFKTLTPTTESDVAQALHTSHFESINWASETDTAQSLRIPKVTPASETDTAQALSLTGRTVISLASETDSAQALSISKHVSVTASTETDSAQGLDADKSASVSAASETDFTQAANFTKTIYKDLVVTTEVDTASIVLPRLSVTTETNVAVPLAPQKFISPIISGTETDSAQTLLIFHLHEKTIGFAEEQDDAQTLSKRGGYQKPETHPELEGIFDQSLTGGIFSVLSRNGIVAIPSNNAEIIIAILDGVHDSSLTGGVFDSGLRTAIFDTSLRSGIHETSLRSGIHESSLTGGLIVTPLGGIFDTSINGGIFNGLSRNGIISTSNKNAEFATAILDGIYDSFLKNGIFDSGVRDGDYEVSLRGGIHDNSLTGGKIL